MKRKDGRKMKVKAMMIAFLCAVALSFFGGCLPSGEGGGIPGGTLFIAATDYQGANVLYRISLAPSWDFVNELPEVDLGDDPQLDPMLPSAKNLAGGAPLVVFRQGWSLAGLGKVGVLDSLGGAVVREFEVNNGADPANPQDILRLEPGKAYVTRFEDPYNDIVIVNPEDGATSGRIDLSPAATNADGLPRATKMLKAGDYVYVLVQNFTASWPYTYATGRIAVIDTATDSLDGVIDLAVLNPAALCLLPGNRLAVAALGDWSDPATSGVEIINLDTRQSEGVAVLGSQLPVSGFIGDIARFPGGLTYILVNAADWSGSYVFQLDLGTGEAGAQVFWSAYVADIEATVSGLLAVADNAGSKVALVEKDGSEYASFDLSVPPQSLMFMQ